MMKESLLAFARLFKSPYVLVGGILMLVMLGSWPAIGVATSFGDDADISSPPALMLVLWAEGVGIAALLGAMFTGFVATAHTPQFAFSVPHLRDRILAGKCITGIFFSVLVGGVVAYFGGWLAGLTIAFGAFAFYAGGGLTTDPVIPRPVRLAVGSVIVLLMVKPWLVQPVLSYAPVLTLSLSVAVSSMIIKRERSSGAARSRVLKHQENALLRTTPYFRILMPSSEATQLEFKGLPRSGRFRDWLAASNHESFGMTNHGRLKLFADLGGYFGLLGHVLDNVTFSPTMAMLTAGNGSFGLIGRAYPISRYRKADVLFVRAVLDSVTLILAIFLVGTVLKAVGIPKWDLGAGLRRQDPLALWFVLALAWMPLIQWPSVTSPLPLAERIKSLKWGASFAIRVGATVGLIASSWDIDATLADNLPWRMLAIGFSFVLISHFVYWRLLRRHFAKADLI